MNKSLFNLLSYDSLSLLYYIVVNESNQIPEIIKQLQKLYDDPGYRSIFIEEYQKRFLDEFLRWRIKKSPGKYQFLQKNRLILSYTR